MLSFHRPVDSKDVDNTDSVKMDVTTMIHNGSLLELLLKIYCFIYLTLLHSEWPKTPWSFGRFECNRVKGFIHSVKHQFIRI